MTYSGILHKMQVKYADPVEYFLPLEQGEIFVNELLGKKIILQHTGEKFCVKCGAKTNKTFGEGFCYHCFVSAPEADVCIVHPEKCRAHEGISRDLEWSKSHCLTEHYVYLAVTSGLKVGVTRKSQIPTRWIDQGAVKAIKLAKTPYRQLAGEIEVFLKQFYADKTGWQKMLKNEIEQADLVEAKRNAASLLRNDLKQYLCLDNEVLEIKYPVLKYPQKVKSLNFDKTPQIEGVLTGIKGQYLIFDTGEVLNIRRFSGYFVNFDF